ncbi:MAG: hypothetical protein GY908_07770 [Flavobacteriales bacterium]|nr:hypothetical protein [Flavobacteriales bacterium]
MKFIRKFSLTLGVLAMSCQVNDKKEPEIQQLSPPVSENSMQPYLSANGSELLFTWTEQENDTLSTLYFSKFDHKKWTEKTLIKKGQNWFVNWADFPSVVGDKEHLISYYLKKSDAETYAYDIFLRQSNDSGMHWSIENKLHSDSTKTEHGFVSLAPSNSDSFFVSWLDGRITKSTGHDHAHEANGGAMQIRVAEILRNGDKRNEFELDSRTCDCCQTSTAFSEDGPIVVWRDRSDQEIRDIYYSKLKDGNWSKPKPVYQDNWKINGCPVNGPKVAVNGGSVAVAWFTAAENIPKVKLAFSKDGGAQFLDPIEMNLEKAIGRVDLLMVDDQTALVSWMESSKEMTQLKLAKVGIGGNIEKIISIHEISADRSTGFPQLELVDDQIYLAWNEMKDDKPMVKMMRLSFDVLN